MYIRRWVLTLFAVALFIASAASMDPVVAQQRDKNAEKARQEEIQAVLKLADAAALGQPTPADIAMTCSADFLKAQEGRTYVPFTLTIPAEPAPPTGLMMYLRLVSKNPPVPVAPAPADKDKKGDKDKKRPEYAFEDAYPVDLKAPEGGQYRFSRALSVAAGDYDMFVVLKERAPVEKDKKNKNPVYKSGTLKHALTVPDYWNGQLATSTVILAANVEPLQAPLTPQEMKEQPYTLGTTKITPAASAKFSKKGELSVVFIVYNTSPDANRKPDVTVEYSFYQMVATADKGEKFFNKTNPQNFNASTLPPQFDPAVGHQLVAGQSVPLGSFPEGDYRLEIKVTDKLAGKNVTHNVPFSVGS